MYIDAQGTFSDAQAVTTSAASTNLINLGVDGNLGIGEPMSVVIFLDVLATATNTDETYVATLQTDALAAFGSPATIGTATINRGAAAGSRDIIPVPADTTCEEHIRVYFTHGGTSPTATYTAFLIPNSMIQNYVDYADGFTVS